MKRILSFLVTAIFLSMTLTGCHKDELRELHKNIEEYRDLVIPSMEAQVSSIEASVDKVKAMQGELAAQVGVLEAIISSFQPTMENIKKEISDFTAKSEKDLSDSRDQYLGIINDMESSMSSQLEKAGIIAEALAEKNASMDAYIDSLEAYLAGNFAEIDWVKATFASLEIQNKLYTDVETIKDEIDILTASTDALYDRMTKLVDGLLKDFGDEFSDELKTEVEKLTKDYQAAVSKLKDEIKGEFKSALDNAIKVSEDSIKKIIFPQLTKEYLTVDSAKALINAFYAIVGRDSTKTYDKSIQEEIKALDNEISGMEAALKPAFESFLRKAITDSLGKVSTIMQAEFQNVKNSIGATESRFDEIDDNLKELEMRVTTLETKMYSLNLGIGNFRDTLDSLNNVFTAFFGNDWENNNLKAIIEDIRGKIDEDSLAIIENRAAWDVCYNDIYGEGGLASQIADLLHIADDFEQLDSNLVALRDFFGDVSGKTLSEIVSEINTAIDQCAKAEDLNKLKGTIDELVKNVSYLEIQYNNCSEDIEVIQAFLDTTGLGIGKNCSLDSLLNYLRGRLKVANDSLGRDTTTLKGYISRVNAVSETVKGLEGLLNRMKNIENNLLNNILPLIDTTDQTISGKTLVGILEIIQTSLNDLAAMEVYNVNSTDRTLRNQLDSIDMLLTEIQTRINMLSAQATAYNLENSFATITYVPTRLDHVAEILNSDSTVSFDFIVSQASLAPVLDNLMKNDQTKQYFKIQWISGSSVPQDFVEPSYSFAGQVLKITATASDALKTAASGANGAFAAFYVDVPLSPEGTPENEKITLSFTSDFVKMEVVDQRVNN